ncbi:uncharacterized protein G2W53_001349 [Senna tora]|uniref:Uncharacterized protein n=1 Tax=Senna tora TaxID=362788 RepID=A0A834XHH6_9FABA|nr:uncharacterized protein G2W53_001349 [Senna tora]
MGGWKEGGGEVSVFGEERFWWVGYGFGVERGEAERRVKEEGYGLAGWGLRFGGEGYGFEAWWRERWGSQFWKMGVVWCAGGWREGRGEEGDDGYGGLE